MTQARKQSFAVSLIARNYVVPWPSKVWWWFRRKEPRRMGFRVTVELDADSAADARERAELRVREEMNTKAQNSSTDPFRLEVEGVALADSPIEHAGMKRWFQEP